MDRPVHQPRILSLADLRRIGEVKTFEARRRDSQLLLDREERLEQWAKERGYDLNDFFCGAAPKFVTESVTSRATCDAEVVL